jgi:hypothetical protein
MYIEFKYGKNKLSDSQLEFQEHCNKNDYKTAVCYSAFEAAKIVVRYLMKGF